MPTGMANTYASYAVTFEEYQVQRYEGGSTLYGPHTLTILQQQYARLYTSMENGQSVPAGPSPPNQTRDQLSFLLPVVVDNAAIGRPFGRALVEPRQTYRRGEELFVTFVAGNPRNDLRTESSYFFVERQLNAQWITVATDANWETRFIWVI